MGALLAATPLAATYIGEGLSVDSCLDSGGSYDYAVGACDYKVNHPYVSFAERHPRLVMASPLAIVVAGTLTGIFAVALSSGRLTSR
jgi:hypothetical protein